MALVTVSITSLSMTFFSENRGIIAGLQDSPLVVMATSISAITATLTTSDIAMPTVLVLIALITFLNGLILILLGKFKLGILVRYLPYPVIGGFMAGTGIMLILGGIGTMIDYNLSANNLVRLFSANQLELWLPGVLFGLLLFSGTRRIQHSLALPGLLLAEGILFYLLLMFSDSTVKNAADAGLLLGDLNLAAGWPFINPKHFFSARWDIIQGQLANIGAVLIITPISLLLNLSGIEMSERKDMDLNHELQAAGKTNILSALAGGMIGFHSLGSTSLGRDMTMTMTRTRTLGIITGIMPLLILFFGGPLLFFVPKAVLGGLLIFQGILFLYNWLIKKWSTLPLADYGMITIIGLTIMATNFMTGIVLGFLVMMFTFVISYSRTDIFYRKLSGAELTSNVLRSSRERKQLVRLGWHTHLLELHGFIFFGTANAILSELQSRLRASLPLQYLIIDFRRVTGVDSSAAFCFTRILYLADSLNFTVILSSLSSQLKQQMLCNGIRPNEKSLKFASDLDRALSWCEDALLEPNSGSQESLALPLQLLAKGFKREQIRLLKSYLQKSALSSKELLVRQGETSDSVYFVESGQISIYLQTGNQHPVRLQTICIGTLIGEIGYCLNIPRTATIVADTDTVVYRLTKSSMQAIQREEPLLAESIKDLMLRVIAERLVTANRQLLDSGR